MSQNSFFATVHTMTPTFVARTIKNMSRFARGVMLTTP